MEFLLEKANLKHWQPISPQRQKQACFLNVPNISKFPATPNLRITEHSLLSRRNG